ncbi:hypothetical protein P691DRAFT_715190, partial [Macrolepiota fuliginosa MF-IS2]
MSGVEYHSSARAPPPRCCEGTRTRFIDMVEHSSDNERLLFLYGPAGVGKSAIVQTLAEHHAEGRPLSEGATLFFPPLTLGNTSRPPPDDSSKVWLTISYRLAALHPAYAKYANELMKHDPRLVEANMQYQFQKLIAEPFGGKQLLPPACLLPIFIDGLDQCRGHETQRQILQLIGKFISNYPFAPLLWIITSRPDRRLLKEVEEFSPKDRTRMNFIPVDSDDARADVKHFLQTEFSGCQRYYGITAPWPEKDDF